MYNTVEHWGRVGGGGRSRAAWRTSNTFNRETGYAEYLFFRKHCVTSISYGMDLLVLNGFILHRAVLLNIPYF